MKAAPRLASRPFRPIGATPANPIKSMTYENTTFSWIHGDGETRIFYKNFGLPYLADLAGGKFLAVRAYLKKLAGGDFFLRFLQPLTWQI